MVLRRLSGWLRRHGLGPSLRPGRTRRSPLLTTIVLNWNRAHLLEKTLRSYVETVSVDHEIIVVDNGSDDGSAEVIQTMGLARSNYRVVMLPSNIGGEALNIGIAQARGEYIHISENDIEYLPGWDAELLRKFERFPELGQLSPFSPFPEIDRGEVWVEKPAEPLTREAVTIYVAEGNLGTTCIFRRRVWDAGVRWKNYESRGFKFPADHAFSLDVKALGYLVAWNDRYVVVNWGHNIREMAANPAYYVENYSAKPWLGLEGWRDRLKDHGFRLVVDEDGNYAIAPEDQSNG